jgi:cyclohexanecarboxylate-CoA ligase
MLDGLPHLRHLVVLGGEGENSFESALMRDDTPPVEGPGLAPDDVLLLMYTSGTTGAEGVMHTSNTLFSNLLAYGKAMELGQGDVILGASPMAHLTGYAYLAMLPLILNATTVLQDIWEARRALQIACAEGVTFSMASTPSWPTCAMPLRPASRPRQASTSSAAPAHRFRRSSSSVPPASSGCACAPPGA